MTILEIVEDVISNAHQNGYGAEIDAMNDEELAWDFVYSGVFETDVDIDEVIKAVKEFRSGMVN